MRTYVRPRATWRTCWHAAVGVYSSAFVVLVPTLAFVLTVWTGDPRIGATGAILGAAAVVPALVSLAGHISRVVFDEACEQHTWPLPWRRRLRDG